MNVKRFPGVKEIEKSLIRFGKCEIKNMNVYFSASHRNIEESISLYTQIKDAIQACGHVLVNDWREAALHKWPRQQSYDDWTSVCIEARNGIESANLVVAEASGKAGFGVGFEVATALNLGKRVIILVEKGQVNNSYASGLDRSGIWFREYTLPDLESVLSDAFAGIKEGQ